MENIDIQRLDHHGLVMGVIKDLRLVEEINKRLGSCCEETVSYGGLGFTDQPLSLMAEYFENIPLPHLFGKPYQAKNFNRFSLARALDKCFLYGDSKLFSELALHCCALESVNMTTQSFDTTSFSVTGEYNREQDETCIQVKHGYSKDHRPDLKQVVTELLVSHDGGIPLHVQNHDGNASDNTIFKERSKALVQQFKSGNVATVVADSKFYTKENSQHWSTVRFVTRVPESLNIAKKYITKASSQKVWQFSNTNQLQYQTFKVTHYETMQTWVVCKSESSMRRANKSIDLKVSKEAKSIDHLNKTLKNKDFACVDDAKNAVNESVKKLKYHTYTGVTINDKKYYSGRGKPKDENLKVIKYRVQIITEVNEAAIIAAKDHKASFIIASNDLTLPNSEHIISLYKQQSSVENGYRFLKDPQFFTSSFFLKTPERISALIMIMTLALLVYTIAQRRLREAMKQAQETLPNQIQNQVKKLTLRRAFQLMRGINIVTYTSADDNHSVVQGLSEVKEKIITFIGGGALKIYRM